jgi:hypothetical protein
MLFKPDYTYASGKFKGKTLRQRLLDSTALSDKGCWEWTGQITAWGYGVLSVEGKKALAHRVSAEVLGSVVIDGVCVLHRCDNPRCINPSHLFTGTQLDNVKDRVEKGRCGGAAGERNGRSRLSASDVAGILRMIDERAVSQTVIAEMFGVSGSHVSNIKARRKW